MLGSKYPVPELDLEEELEKLDLRTKVRLLPAMAGMKPLVPGTQPYQDMTTLVTIRNDLVHYKMGLRIPPCVRDLQQRRIALRRTARVLFSWTDAISTVEGIRWAHNTACAVIGALAAEIPMAPSLKAEDARFTRPIPETWISEQQGKRRLSPLFASQAVARKRSQSPQTACAVARPSCRRGFSAPIWS